MSTHNTCFILRIKKSSNLDSHLALGFVQHDQIVCSQLFLIFISVLFFTN